MKKLLFICCALLSVLLSGCQPIIREDAENLTRFSVKQNVDDYDKNYYPVKIKNINSANEENIQVYDKPPQRIIAFWQNSIETLIALGVGDRIIAGTGLPDKKYLRPEYQEQYTKIPYTGLENLDIETITMLQPDFLLGWYSTFSPKVAGGTDYWNSRGVNTYIATSSAPAKAPAGSLSKPRHTLAEEYDYILDLGKIFDKNEKANELVTQMKDEIKFVTDKTQIVSSKPRAIIIEFLGKDISVYGERTLAGNILQSLNGQLLEPDVERFSFEQLIDLNPDAIFVIITEAHYSETKMYLDRIYHTKALQDLSCVKNKRVYPLPLYAVYSPGIRAYDGILIIAKGLYPDLYKEQ